MKFGHRYMHKNCLDLAVEITGQVAMGENFTGYWVKWWNLGYSGGPWKLRVSEEFFKIPNEDLKNWLDITAFFYQKRFTSGRPK